MTKEFDLMVFKQPSAIHLSIYYTAAFPDISQKIGGQNLE